MKKITVLFVVFILLFSLSATSQSLSGGSLVIVGGGLEAGNKSVYQQMIGLAGGADKATFAVIPSASGVPMQSYVSFRNILISYGLKPGNIRLVNVAMVDDDSTTDINESEWKNNGNDLRLAELIRNCSAVWFTGGDQSRTMKTLVRPDGSQTPVLQAVWDVYRSGGVLGGSSAGAAIMSGVMIGGGTSIAALTHGIIKDYAGDDFPEDTGIMITRGLGFFPYGIVDQHFIARARIGRLAVALMNEKAQGTLGFGVDENTALIYHGKQNRITVAGASGVTILNSSDARISYAQNMPVIENLSVSYLEEGDSWDATTGIITPAEGKQSIKGKEHHSDRHPVQDGILSGSQTTFRDLITICLADNKAADIVQNFTMVSPVSGFLVTLRKSPSSEMYYTNKPDHVDHYNVINIMMDIIPVDISVTPLKNQY
jgi:cyanophycinase